MICGNCHKTHLATVVLTAVPLGIVTGSVTCAGRGHRLAGVRVWAGLSTISRTRTHTAQVSGYTIIFPKKDTYIETVVLKHMLTLLT